MSEKLYFTKRGFEKSKREIASLTGRLSSLHAQTASVREVDHDEDGSNGSIESLNDEIRIISRRLQEARGNIKLAEMAEPVYGTSYIAIGNRVEIIKNGEKMTWDIVGFGESDPDNNLIAYNTPLAILLINKRKGEKIKNTIGGNPVEIEIIDISESKDLPQILEDQESLATVN
jgi:transcription elongation factor GreA